MTFLKFPSNSFSHSIALVSVVCAAICLDNTCFSEQIVIDENSQSGKVAGDFICSPCYIPILNDAQTLDFSSSMTTGELYKYFQARGIKSLNRLSFKVDVDCDPDNTQSVCLTDLNFAIEDSSQNIVTLAEFGANELFLDKSEITSFKPEAVLEFDLGYDFMQRFNSESQDSVSLNFNSEGSSEEMKPRVILVSEISSFSTYNFTRISGFVAFWAIVFLGVNLVTRKSVDRTLTTNPGAGAAPVAN